MSRLKRSSRGRNAHDYTIIVAYDGERTEDEYFRGWQQILSPDRMTLLPIHVRSGGNPLKAVKESNKAKSSCSGYAEFWCVFDIDGAPADIIATAQAFALKNGIKICPSNRCFETWISLHFRITSAPINSESEAINLVRQDIPS